MRPRRRSLKAPESLEAILDRAGENRFARARPPIAAKVWRDAVGARIAERALPLSLSGGVLLLRVPTSVWANELSFLGEELCARLRERGVDARQLRFHVGALPAVDRPPERRETRAVPRPSVHREPPHELALVLGRVRDVDLRAAIARAATANLAWQEVTRVASPGPVSEAQRAARAPRSAAGESAPPAPAKPASRGGAPGNRGGARDRSR